MAEATPKSPRSRSRSGSRSPLSRLRSKKSMSNLDPSSEKPAEKEKTPKSRSFFGFGKSPSSPRSKVESPRKAAAAAVAAAQVPASAATAPPPPVAAAGVTCPSSPAISPPATPEKSVSPAAAGTAAAPFLDLKAAGQGSEKPKSAASSANANGGGARGAKTSTYRKDRLPKTLSALLFTATLAVAVALFYGHAEGPRLAKRDAPLYDGDVLRGGEYINICTGALSFGCAPKYLELSLDGELGLYEGAAPPAAAAGGFFGLAGVFKSKAGGGSDENEAAVAKIWGSGTKARGSKARDAAFVAEYKDGAVSLQRDGKVVWKTPVSRLPKDMQPWPFHA